MPANPQITPALLRERAGLTQRDVAIALNKREATISDWERKVKYPKLSFSEIVALVQLYQCSLEELAAAFDSPAP
jgi:transcriptional regulator with XRE-family HTH domain